MKTRWKVMICCLMVLLIANLTVSPTLAWLSASTDPLVNYFSGGGIGLKLDEAPVDEHGKHCEGDRVTENHYRFTPGAVLDKDPTVTVLADSERCYVYVCVLNELPEAYFEIDFKEDAWTLIVSDQTMSIYRYESVVESSEEDQVLTPIFTQISVSKDLDYEMIKALGSRQLSVTAYAVQADSMEQDTADSLAEEYFRENVEITEIEPVEPSEPQKPHRTTSVLEGDAQEAAESSEETDSTGTENDESISEETAPDALSIEEEAAQEGISEDTEEEETQSEEETEISLNESASAETKEDASQEEEGVSAESSEEDITASEESEEASDTTGEE